MTTVDGMEVLDISKRVGWLVWIYYKNKNTEDMPQPRGLTLRESGLTVQVYVGDSADSVVGPDTPVAQFVSADDNSTEGIQFFVSTKGDEGGYETPSLKIKIVVTGLTPHETTFTIPDQVDKGTLQTDPLEGSN